MFIITKKILKPVPGNAENLRDVLSQTYDTHTESADAYMAQFPSGTSCFVLQKENKTAARYTCVNAGKVQSFIMYFSFNILTNNFLGQPASAKQGYVAPASGLTRRKTSNKCGCHASFNALKGPSGWKISKVNNQHVAECKCCWMTALPNRRQVVQLSKDDMTKLQAVFATNPSTKQWRLAVGSLGIFLGRDLTAQQRHNLEARIITATQKGTLTEFRLDAKAADQPASVETITDLLTMAAAAEGAATKVLSVLKFFARHVPGFEYEVTTRNVVTAQGPVKQLAGSNVNF